MTKAAMKTAAIFFFLLVNATWVFVAYLLHVYETRVPTRLVAIVVVVGASLSNVTVYGSLKLAPKLLSILRIQD
jgi:hypothetical protein